MAERQKVIVDPAVDAILRDNNRRKQRRGMTQEQRKQAIRHRVTFELDPRVAQMIEVISKAEECSPASVVNLLVARVIRQYVSGEISFEDHRRVSRSPRYDWVIVLPEDVDSLVNELEKRGQK